MEPQQTPLVQKFDEAPMHISEYTYNVEPERFVFDFKSVTPQFGPGGQPLQIMLVHKVVALEPHLAKTLAEQLQKAIVDYEEKFGKIVESEARQKARQQMESLPKHTTSKPSYYG